MIIRYNRIVEGKETSNVIIADKTFVETAFIRSERPVFTLTVDCLRDGDTIVFSDMATGFYNIKEVISFVEEMLEKNIQVIFEKERFCFSSKFDFNTLQNIEILKNIFNFTEETRYERQREGIAIARKANRYDSCGRKCSLSNKQKEEVISLRKKGMRVVDIAKMYNVSRQTIYTVFSEHEKS